MKFTKMLCLVLALLLLCGCAAPSAEVPQTTEAAFPGTEPVPTETAAPSPERTEEALGQIAALGQSPDDNNRVWYEVFVYAYCDSDGDGIGDLNGLRQKLPYLRELGVTGLWLMPIHPSTTYHKYNVSDYYAIDPDYGTMEDFDALMADCQAMGIRVILDLVLNHTGSEHPAFREAAQYLCTLEPGAEPDPEVCPYVGWYNFTTEANRTGYCQVQGCDWWYEAGFSYDMPDLNLENPEVLSEIRKIMAFWLDKGVAGFRLDAAKEYFSGRAAKNVETLSWLMQTARELKEDVYLVAEVWESSTVIAQYYASGITSIFNFPFGDSGGKITKTIRGYGMENIVSAYAVSLEKADTAYREANPDYIDAPFLSNHDVGRIAGFACHDPAHMKLAAAMNLFMGGAAFVYYGEEIGMPGSGNDPSKRAPMYWNANRDDGTTKPCPECVLPDSYPLGSLEEQRNDDNSLYNYYRQAIAIRNALPVISHGAVTAETALNVGCVSAQRKTWGEETCLILMNIDEAEATVDLTGYESYRLAAQLVTGDVPVTLEGSTLTLPPCAVAILLP